LGDGPPIRGTARIYSAEDVEKLYTEKPFASNLNREVVAAGETGFSTRDAATPIQNIRISTTEKVLARKKLN
jgi:hypothetical protein